jgi:iron complex transport system ATP-binding protein
LLEARSASLRVVKRISLTLRPGEFIAVLGPNGAGKSTLLKLLSGEWRPVAGQIFLRDVPLASWKPRDRARTIAVLPQSSSLNSPFTALEIVCLGRTPHAASLSDETIAREALAAVEAAGLADRLYTKLSGGEQQRVQLARVLAQIWESPPHGERYLLLDEPTANLDLTHQHSALQLAHRMTSEGVGVFVVMHDLNLAARHADRILLLKEGEILAAGAPGEVLTPDLIQAAFSHSAAVISHPRLRIPLIVPD